jgi:hypothetical protein
VGSLIGQDWSKLAFMAFIVIGTVMNTMQLRSKATEAVDGFGERTPVNEDRLVLPSETTFGRIFAPAKPNPATMKPREADPEAAAPEGGSQ